jgi:predicted component of type VI protein secretion system
VPSSAKVLSTTRFRPGAIRAITSSKYEVETEGALIEKELPFVVGVLGDFTGDPSRPLTRGLRTRSSFS